MSHTTTISNIVFTDIHALEAAVRSLQSKGIKCELKTNARARAYYQDQKGMDKEFPYVLHLQDSRFDVGFKFDDTLKGYTAVTDLWGGHVANVLGGGNVPLGKLYQAYGVQATAIKAAQSGMSVQEVTKPDGTIQLIIGGFE